MESGLAARQCYFMDARDAEAYRTLHADIEALFPAGSVRKRWLAWLDSLMQPSDVLNPAESVPTAAPELNAYIVDAAPRRSDANPNENQSISRVQIEGSAPSEWPDTLFWPTRT